MKTIHISSLGKPVSRISLGCWAIGGGPAWGVEGDAAQAAKKNAIETIRACPDVGINMLDTAPGYNFGNSERIIGEAIRDMSREDICIVTKYGLVWDREGTYFDTVGDTKLYRNLSGESILREIDASLERLQTDYVDIYMSHWQSEAPYFTPVAETASVLNDLKAKGKIRGIGVANVTAEHIEEYMKYCKVDIVQAQYNMLDREVEKELLPICKEQDIILQAYSPLAMGLLSGTLPHGYKPVAAQLFNKWFQPERMPKVFAFLEQMKPFMQKYGCKMADLALSWILAQDDHIVLLSGANTPEQIICNAHAADVEIEPDDLVVMRELAEAVG